MAKVSKIAKNEKRKALSEKYRSLRKELRAKVVNEKLPDEERYEAQSKLRKLPKDSCEIRVRNRCLLTGRPRGNYKMFGLSRIAFRELALRGMIPGIKKSSW